MSIATEQQNAVISLYSLLTDGNMVFTDEESDVKAMARFVDLFDYCAAAPKDLAELNRRWLPTFDAAKHVAGLMEQNRISVIEVAGGAS